MSTSEKQQLTEQLAQAQAALSAYTQGTNPAGSGGGTGGSGASPAGGVALQLVKVLQQQVGNLEARLAAQEKQRKALKKVCNVLFSFSSSCPFFFLFFCSSSCYVEGLGRSAPLTCSFSGTGIRLQAWCLLRCRGDAMLLWMMLAIVSVHVCLGLSLCLCLCLQEHIGTSAFHCNMCMLLLATLSGT